MVMTTIMKYDGDILFMLLAKALGDTCFARVEQPAVQMHQRWTAASPGGALVPGLLAPKEATKLSQSA